MKGSDHMKTHKRTLILMLVFCVLMTTMPGLIFAETEPPVETAGTSAEEEAAPLPDRDPVSAEEAAAPAEEGKTAEEAPPDSEDKGAAEEKPEEKEKEKKEADPDDEPEIKEAEVKETEESSKREKAGLVASGDKLSFTASKNKTSNAVIFKATLNGQSYKGTCNECGVAYRSSGTMTVTPLAKNDLRRKVAYKYGSWLESEDRNYNMGGVYKGACLECMMQYARAWQDDKKAGGSSNRNSVVKQWKKSPANGGAGWSSATCSAITDAVKALNGKTADQLGIPGKFRAYFGSIKNSKSDGRVFGQDAVFWGDLVTGTISLKKIPAAEIEADVAEHPENYDLGGAVYQLWTDKACTVKAKDVNWANATFTTKSDGTSNTRTMEVGTYYMTETKAPAKGYAIDIDESGKTKVHTVKIKKGEKSLPSVEEPGVTVILPKISTTASLQDSNREVKDIIQFEDIRPDTKYVFKGWLVDTETGDKVPDSDGRVELEGGTETSGQVEMILSTEKYDEMEGHSLTAFEELYEVEMKGETEKETLVAEHKDTEDSNQTVEFYQDLKLRKKVTGNLGDTAKVFEFTIAFTGLVPDGAYDIEGDDEKTFMADADGNASIPVDLKDGQEAVIKRLPKSASYMITEAASDHVAGFRLFPEDMDEEDAKIIVREASNEGEARKILSTAEETVDIMDGTIIVLWENNKDQATLTGLAGPDYPVYIAVLAVLVLASGLIIRKRIS